MFVVLIPLFEMLEWRRGGYRCHRNLYQSGSASINVTDIGGAENEGYSDGEQSALLAHTTQVGNRAVGRPAGVITSRRTTLKAAAVVAPLWFLAQWSFNVSLAMTSVASNTIVSSTAAIWTLGTSILFAGEEFSWPKLVGVLCCVGGTAVVSIGDRSAQSIANRTNSSANHTNSSGGGGNHHDREALYGNMICLCSSVAYAVYTTALRKWCNSPECSMLLLFGYIGLLSLVVMGPLLVLMHKFGVVSLQLTLAHFWWIVGKGLVDNVLSDYLWGVAVLLTTPTVASVVLNVQVPIALVADAMVQKVHPTASSIGGAVLVTIGCLFAAVRWRHRL